MYLSALNNIEHVYFKLRIVFYQYYIMFLFYGFLLILCYESFKLISISNDS